MTTFIVIVGVVAGLLAIAGMVYNHRNKGHKHYPSGLIALLLLVFAFGITQVWVKFWTWTVWSFWACVVASLIVLLIMAMKAAKWVVMNAFTWVAFVVALALLVITPASTAFANAFRDEGTPGNGSASPSPSASASPSATTQAMSDELRKLLTVSDGLENCTDIVSASGTTVVSGVYNLHIDALLPAGDGTNGTRKWSDAMGTPVKGDTPQAQLADVKSTICSDPLLGVTVANWFASMTIQGAKLTDLNNWLQPFTGNASQIDGWTASFVPSFGVKSPTDAQLNAQLDANRKYQELANRLVTLVDRAQLVGVASDQSIVNYHLVGAGATAGVIPPVELNPNQESLPALVLNFTEKGACAPASAIGFNVGDKRPETFAVPPCTTPTPPATTPPTPGTPGKPSTPPSTPPPPKDVCLNIPGTQTSVPPGKYQEGDNCYEQKSHTNDVTPPAGTNQQGPGPATSANQGTGAGTSGNAVNNTPGGDSGSSVPAQGASPAPATSTPPPAGTGTTSNGGSSTVNGSNPGGGNSTPIATPFG